MHIKSKASQSFILSHLPFLLLSILGWHGSSVLYSDSSSAWSDLNYKCFPSDYILALNGRFSIHCVGERFPLPCVNDEW